MGSDFPPRWVILVDQPVFAWLFAHTHSTRSHHKVIKSWHNSCTGYSHFVSVWSCVYIWQHVHILDQFPLTLVSGTMSLIFHYRGLEGWFPIDQWRLNFLPELFCLPGIYTSLSLLRPQAVHQTWWFKWLQRRLLSIYTDGLCFANEHMLLFSTD